MIWSNFFWRFEKRIALSEKKPSLTRNPLILFFSLRKAKVHADALEQLCAESTIVDARSKLETQAYAYWITGNLHFETNNWAESLKFFNLAKAIYEKLGSTLNEEEAASYQVKFQFPAKI